MIESRCQKLDRSRIPGPIFEDNPRLVKLYWLAWEQAWDHVVERTEAPQSPYMDEAFDPDVIWIWDTCFMVHFCKYAPELFPGIESFENFYAPLLDGHATPLQIHHPDNPPLFAWIEYEYYRFTGDRAHLRKILIEKRYLQRHFDFIERNLPGTRYPFTNVPAAIHRHPSGYRWSGNPSGMDNTPRGRGNYDAILWVDALAQQALAALYIGRLAEVLGEAETAVHFRTVYAHLRSLLNRYYWDQRDGIYYDVLASDPSTPCRVKTPASYWPMLALACSPEQAKRMAKHAKDPDVFGGSVPWPSVSRDDPDYQTKGMYWRGGVWLPMAYMATKALERYGYGTLADETAARLLHHIARTYEDYEPHTIWECYQPEAPLPATGKDNVYRVRPDFCGWSALGPISLLIENVLGFHTIDAPRREVRWRKHQPGRHGIRGLRFGEVATDIVALDESTIEVHANAPYTLIINNRPYAVRPGYQTLRLHHSEA